MCIIPSREVDASPNSTAWIMNAQRKPRSSSNNEMSSTNSLRLETTAPAPPREPFVLQNVISRQIGGPWTRSFQCTCGISPSHTRNSPSISCEAPESTRNSLHGNNATPIAPPGVRVLAHTRAGERGTWATHAFEAWYIGPALDHYRCFTVWATESRKPRIVNQVVWFPPKTLPKLTSGELLRATIEDLKVLILHPPTDSFVGNM
jgi:hypothetical protein